MATYVEGFEPLENAQYVEGFEPIETVAPVASTDPVSPQERQAIVAEAQTPTIDRLIGLATLGPRMVGSLANIGLEAGKDLLGSAQSASNVVGAVPAMKQFYGDVAQSGLEGATRVGFNLANQARQVPSALEGAIRQAIEEPSSLLSPTTFLTSAIRRGLTPSTPTEAEIQAEGEKRRVNAVYEEALKQGVAPAIPGVGTLGTMRPGIANAVEQAILLAAPVPKGLGAVRTGTAAEAALTGIKQIPEIAGSIPAVETAARLATGAKDLAVGGAKMAAEKVIPKPLIENIVTVLDPRGNSINPEKTVQAMKTARRSVERVLPELDPVVLEHPQSLADASITKLQEIHKSREALAGAPVEINLDSLANAYEKLAADKVLQTTKPEIIPLLSQKAQQYRGQILNGEQAEKALQILNADNEFLYAQSGTKRAQAIKSNPILQGGEDAAKALRSQLDDAFGAQFGELGKDYGAWREIGDLAQRQAVKQAKIEGNLSLYEGLSALQAIGASGEPLKAGLSLAGGQILKYAGSPASGFKAASRRLAADIKKGRIPPKAPPVIPPARPIPIPRNIDDEIIAELQRINSGEIAPSPAQVGATQSLEDAIRQQLMDERNALLQLD